MNPLTNVKNITKLNEIELAKGYKKSWHDMYKDSAWIFIGGLPYSLTEGDVLAVFSQYGEIVNINMVRDKKTGKTKGYCFLCYANQKSTILAVDNLNAIKLCNRTIRVDHVANYKPPKENEGDDEITKMLKSEGCAPHIMQASEKKEESKVKKKKEKKSKKEKKEHKKKKRKHSEEVPEVKVKKEKRDPGYDQNDNSKRSSEQESRERRPDKESSNIDNSYRSETEKHHNRQEFKEKERSNLYPYGKERKESSDYKERSRSTGRREYSDFKDRSDNDIRVKSEPYSSSADESSSSSTSSDDEESKYECRQYSKRDLNDKSSQDKRLNSRTDKCEKYRTSSEKQTKNRNKYDDRQETDYESSKSRLYKKKNRHSDR